MNINGDSVMPFFDAKVGNYILQKTVDVIAYLSPIAIELC